MLIYGNFYSLHPSPLLSSRHFPTIPSQKLSYFYPGKCATAMVLKAKQEFKVILKTLKCWFDNGKFSQTSKLKFH